MDPAECPHGESHRLSTQVEDVWEVVCESCGLSAYGTPMREADRVFHQNAQRARGGEPVRLSPGFERP